VSALEQGVITVRDAGGSSQTYGITKGFVEVLGKEVALLVQEVEV